MADDRGLWANTAGPAPDAAGPDGAETADLVVIGGGFTGLIAALRAAEAGASVVVLEKTAIGAGGSGRNVGLVNAGLWTPPDQIDATLGAEAGGRLSAALADGPSRVFELIERHQIRCEARREGTLHCAFSAAQVADLKTRHAQLSARGAPVRLLGEAEASARTGAAGVKAALHDPRAGTVQPLAYVYGLARAAIAAGARIRVGCAVEDVRRKGEGWRAVFRGGRVDAGAALLATNAYSDAGVGRAVRAAVVPVHYFQAATPPLPPDLRARILPGGEGAWDAASVMSSFRTDAAGRLIIGAVGDGSGAHRAWAARKAKALFPELPAFEPDHVWAGRIGFTGDHLPRMVELGPRFLGLYAYNGRGIAPSAVLGAAAADRLLGALTGPAPLDPTPPPEPIAFRGARAWSIETGARLFHWRDAR